MEDRRVHARLYLGREVAEIVRYDRAGKDALARICAQESFYASAPEHLAQAVDDAAAALDAAREAIGAEAQAEILGSVSKDDAAKLEALQEKIRIQTREQSQLHGDPIRSGSRSAESVKSRLCKQ